MTRSGWYDQCQGHEPNAVSFIIHQLLCIGQEVLFSHLGSVVCVDLVSEREEEEWTDGPCGDIYDNDTSGS